MRASDQWLPSIKSRGNPIARLICFPHSGGDASAFAKWGELMPDSVELRGVQLPGRGARFNEALLNDLVYASQQIASAISELTPLPLVLLGHSLGGLLCYETACALEAGRAARTVKHIFVLGCRNPGFHASKPLDSSPLSDERIIELMQRYRRTPEQLIEDPNFASVFLPVMRADLNMIAGYRPLNAKTVRVPVTVLAGTREKLEDTQLDGWAAFAGGYFSKHRIRGGHFFAHSNRKLTIKHVLLEVATTTGVRLDLAPDPKPSNVC